MTNYDEKILATSDKLYDSIRDYVGAVLGDKVYDYYPQTVKGGIMYAEGWTDNTKDICDMLFDMIETKVEEYKE